MPPRCGRRYSPTAIRFTDFPTIVPLRTAMHAAVGVPDGARLQMLGFRPRSRYGQASVFSLDAASSAGDG